MSLLKDKVIAITGAGSGIGRSTALECALRGASLALSDINQNSLDKIVEDVKAQGVDVIGTLVDVSKSESVDSWTAQIIQRFGKLDGAANVAGVEGKPGEKIFRNIEDTSDDFWDFVIGVNLTGLFYCVRSQLRVMKSGASILNVASMAGLMGRPGIGSYSTSKHGAIGLTRTAAKEVGERGIRVNALAPGPVDTAMLNRIRTDGGTERAVTKTYQNVPLQRLGTTEDMAKTICFALSDDAGWTTGAVFSVDGGIAC